MENILFIAHVLVALAIIGLILIQQGKGAEMGASFGGGSSQTLFGSSGSGNFFSKMTALLTAVFFVTSFSLALIAKQGASVDDIDLPELEKVTAPVDSAPDGSGSSSSSSAAAKNASTDDALPKLDSVKKNVQDSAKKIIDDAANEELPQIPVNQ